MMRSPAAAFAWEFRHRHRWYLVALAAYLLALGLMKPLFLAPDRVVRFDPPDGFAAFGVVPFSVTFFYLIAVFTFGLTGDVAARQSIYPPRLFTLPVSSAALAGWPMLYGTVAMALLWLIAVTLARWPWGVELPLLWPGLMTAVVLAWLQAFAWMPYGLRGIRVAIAVIVLTSLNALVMTALELKLSQPALVAFLAPQLPIAYLWACAAVARARRGHVPDWSFAFARRGTHDDARQRPPFQSTAAAQFWLEWRRHGRSLSVLVGIVVPFELSVLFISGYGSKQFVFEVLIAVLTTPILMAAFASATVSKANPFAREVYGVSPFAATRPLPTAAMIAAKLKMATLSTIVAWLVLLTAMAIGFAWSGADSVLIGWADYWVNRIGIFRTTVAALIVLGGLISLTWTMLVQGLFIGLTGRQWLVRAIGTATLVFLMAIGPAYEWIADSAPARSWLWNWWQLFPLVLAALKIGAAIWVATRLVRSRLVSDRVLVIGAASWMLAVVLLHAVLVWWVDMPYVPPHLLLLIAILAVPLVRVSAAPLALDWNRHR